MFAALLGYLIFKVPASTTRPDVDCNPLAIFIRASTSVAVVICGGAFVSHAICATPVPSAAALIALFLAHAGLILVPAAYTTGNYLVNPATQAAQCCEVNRTPLGVWNAGTWSSVILLVALCGLAVRAAQAERRFSWPWRRGCDPTWAWLAVLAVVHLVPAVSPCPHSLERASPDFFSGHLRTSSQILGSLDLNREHFCPHFLL